MILLLAILFAVVGVGAIYLGRGSTAWLVVGVVLIVIAVLLAVFGFNDRNNLEDVAWLHPSTLLSLTL